MPITLLAVDDSVTMRKVLEITFAGEDFRVVTADSAGAALAMLRSERPAVVLADVTLDGTNGYGLCQKIKTESPTTNVIILASKQQPYDATKGSAARADDFIEKPFDTQHLIDKVRRVLAKSAAPPPYRAGATPAPPVAAEAPRPAPVPMPSQKHTAPGMAMPPNVPFDSPVAPRSGTRPYSAPVSSPPPSTTPHTQSWGMRHPTPPPTPPAPPPPPVSVPPSVPSTVAATPPPPPPPPPPPAEPVRAAPAEVAAPAAAVAVADAVAQATAPLAAQLAKMGLTEAQIEGVLALSRDVVERVAWEVVPVLAETIIKEELKRLTA